jgi:ABC-type antimicrobial peptide transport system permease subunit
MLFFLDMHYKNDSTAGIVSLIIMIGVLLYSFISFKKQNEGFLSLSEALKIGIGVSLVSALIGIVYTQILVNFLDPDTMKKSLELSMDTMRAENPEMPQEALDTARSMQEKMSSPLIFSAVQIIFALFFGFIISLIGGLIVKKSRPE